MGIFKSSYDKVYNLNIRIDNIIKKEVKKDPNLDIIKLNTLIDIIFSWFVHNINNASNKMYNEIDMLKIIDEDQKILLNIFNMSSLLNRVKIDPMLCKICDKLVNNDGFRRRMLYASLLKTIETKGAYLGAEYGLVFAKTFNFNLAIPTHYASYDSKITNPRLKEYISKYLELGGNKYICLLPYYFNNDKKTKYYMNKNIHMIKY